MRLNYFVKDCWSSQLSKYNAFVSLYFEQSDMIYDEANDATLH